MNKIELKSRTKKFAIDIFRFVDTFSAARSLQIIGYQLCRSASSIAANYNSACRARSYAEFISKIGIVLEESDESLLWLEIIKALHSNSEPLESLIDEVNQLTAIFAAALKTAKSRRGEKQNLKSKS